MGTIRKPWAKVCERDHSSSIDQNVA